MARGNIPVGRFYASYPSDCTYKLNSRSTEYTIVIEKDEDGYYVGSVPGLPGCHTQGKSIDQLLERLQEAIALWLEVEG